MLNMEIDLQSLFGLHVQSCTELYCGESKRKVVAKFTGEGKEDKKWRPSGELEVNLGG